MKDLSLHLLDIVQNSIRARATMIRVTLNMSPDGILKLVVEDNGSGMDAELLERIKDPFVTTRTTRRVGLGIPLLAQKAEQAGGFLSISSEPAVGTRLEAGFRISHPDCPPLGDIPGVAFLMMAGNKDIQMVFILRSQQEEWVWDSTQISDTLEGMSLQQPEIREALMGWFNSEFQLFKQNLK